jgi:CDP-glucose 4,6-dehydratase
MGTVNVLEAARRTEGIRAFVNVTSDKCYENMEWPCGYREIEPMGGRDPYSCSKGCAELITSSYRRSFLENEGMALASVRAGNVIGGGDWSPDRLLPDILRAFEKGKPALIRNPNSIRPWQHVMEPLSGYMGLAEKLYIDNHKWSQAWNFGPNDHDARPVEEIVNYMKRNWGDGADWIKDNADHPHEAHYLKLDVSKSKLHLGWKPKLNLETALDYVIGWHKAWLSNKDAKDITLAQISSYLAH